MSGAGRHRCAQAHRSGSGALMEIRRASHARRCIQRWIPGNGGDAHRLVRARAIGHTFVVLAVGDKAPDFKLPTTGGHELTLAEALANHKSLVFLFYVLDFTAG